MKKIINRNLAGVTLSGRDGKQYVGDEHGVFNLPRDFANFLLGTKGWSETDGKNLGEITGRPKGMSEEDHAQMLARQAAADAAPPPAPPPDTDSARAAVDAATRVPAPAPANGSREVGDEGDAGDQVNTGEGDEGDDEGGDEGGDEEEGPDLDSMSKAELLTTADEYRAKGYEIPDTNNHMLKEEIKIIVSKAIYGE